MVIIKKALLIGSLSLVLSACGTATTAPEETTQHTVKIEQNSGIVMDSSEVDILAIEIPTTFKVNTTELRELTEEDHEVYDRIMPRLNESDGTQLDREIVYEIANELGEDPEAYYTHWLEVVDAVFYGDMGNIVVKPEQQSAVFQDVTLNIIEKNNVKINDIKIEPTVDYSILNAVANVTIDGVDYELDMTLELNEDESSAELTSLIVDEKE